MAYPEPELSLAAPFRKAWQAWSRFWFTPADPLPLGFIRICLGLLLLYVHLAYTYDLQAFFGAHAWVDLQESNYLRHHAPIGGGSFDWEKPQPLRQDMSADDRYFFLQTGIDPNGLTNEQKDLALEWMLNPRLIAGWGHYYWSIWYHVTDPRWMLVIHSLFLVIIFCFTIGLCTRLTAVLTWLATMCYIQRAPTALFGVDTMTNIVMIYLMIGPSGAALSVDRLLRRYWAIRAAARNKFPPPEFADPQPMISANLALRLIQVHLCIVYLVSGLSKVPGPAWLNGTATWMTMANYEFSPMSNPVYMALLHLLARHRLVWEAVMTGGSYFTLAFEISFAFLIWNRHLRGAIIIGAVFLHLGIAICMGLTTFSIMMLIFVSSFLPAQTIHQLVDRMAELIPARLPGVQLEPAK
jgi:Vitamin K-dependent gamma-carboxylase